MPDETSKYDQLCILAKFGVKFRMMFIIEFTNVGASFKEINIIYDYIWAVSRLSNSRISPDNLNKGTLQSVSGHFYFLCIAFARTSELGSSNTLKIK